MTPEQAAQMYERLVAVVLDAENVVTRDERINILREILKKHDETLGKLLDSAVKERQDAVLQINEIRWRMEKAQEELKDALRLNGDLKKGFQVIVMMQKENQSLANAQTVAAMALELPTVEKR